MGDGNLGIMVQHIFCECLSEAYILTIFMLCHPDDSHLDDSHLDDSHPEP